MDEGNQKILFDFEFECIDKDEYLEITAINNKNQTNEELVKYFEIVSEMYKTFHKYIREGDSGNVLKSLGRIIPLKIKELKKIIYWKRIR